MDWKNYAAIGAIIAALITISSNWIGQVLQLRRDKRIALKKALYSLIDVWYKILSIGTVKKMHGEDDYTYSASIAKHLKPVAEESKNLRERHFEALQLLSGEYPVLAAKIQRDANLLSQVEMYANLNVFSSEGVVTVGDKTMSYAVFLTVIDKLTQSSLQQIEDSILLVSRKCGKRTSRETQKLIREELKKRSKKS